MPRQPAALDPDAAAFVLADEFFCRRCWRQKVHRRATAVVAIDGNVRNQEPANLQPVCSQHAEEIAA